jgi:SOS response regulatory protein OraA/RecX
MARKTTARRRVEALRTTAADPNLVEVRVAGRTEATLPRQRAEDLGIAEGTPWTPALAARVDRVAAEALARESALAFLAKRPWSAAALRERLVKGGHTKPAAAAAVAAMVADGWLDDRAFAATRVEHHLRKGAMPAEALAALLEADGVAEREAREAAEQGASTVKELRAEVRAAKRAKESPARVAGRLARRGFDPDTIRDALEHAGYELGE